MKKIYPTRLGIDFYHVKSISLCAFGVSRYFYTGPGLEFHVQTTKPRDDNYHTLKLNKNGFWVFVDSLMCENDVPLMWEVDRFLCNEFPGEKTLYVSAYAYE